MLKDFKAFLLRGNVVDLAVGVVIGVAFGAVIAAIGGKRDFSSLQFTIHKSTFRYGEFINALISFVVIAAAVFFLVVVPVNKLMERRRTERDVEATTRPCPECLSDIPVGARRCSFCTSEVTPATA